MADPAMATLLLLVAVVTLVLPVAYWVLRPLIVGTLPELPPDPRAVALLSEREAALASLRDLDADLRDGRIGEERHSAMRATLVTRAARVLEALDALGAEREGQSAALAAALEQQVDRARAASRPDAPTRPDDPSGTVRVCPSCGYRARRDARFCGGCGESLGELGA